MRYAQIVVGPAGSGKSTYCSTMVAHGEASQRPIHVVNLDPAAEHFDYEPVIDCRELISLEDVMEDEELRLGPNGGLVYCMEFLLDNRDWLLEKLGDYDDEYLLFDIPGQIELFTHFDLIARLIRLLDELGYRMCGVFCLDAQFVTDMAKYMSGTFSALSTLVNLEIPFVNLLTKVDLLPIEQRRQVRKYLEPDPLFLEEDLFLNTAWASKFKRLSKAVSDLINDYSLVRFMLFSAHEEDLVSEMAHVVDNALQYGEHEDVKVRDFEEQETEPQETEGN
jgi:GTPase SAR1 family protein